MIFCNPIKFRILGVKLGKKSRIYNSVYIDVHPNSFVDIGDCFEMSSGDNYNPLSRNIKACIVAEKPNSIIKIGNHVGISSSCLWAKKEIVIGDYVNIGSDSLIMDSDGHSLNWEIRSTKSDGINVKTDKIIISDNVLVGARSIILKGVTIGKRTIIGAGSVVTHSIPNDCIAAGNPCVVIRKINKSN